MAGRASETGKKKSGERRRVGRVTVYLRGRTWYLYYYENQQRVRRQAGPSLTEAKKLAAQINAHLAAGTPAVLSFDPVPVAELRTRWLDHHEHVLRSSIATIRRYRAATEHLLRFTQRIQPVRSADRITPSVTGAFVRYLRNVDVSPNGHANAAKRRLRDKGVIFILESCRTMFNYAAKHRHLSPYQDNPFSLIDIGRIPIEDSKPVDLFTPEQEAKFFEACDDWGFP